MTTPVTPEIICHTLLTAFPTINRPTPKEVEAVMRPLGIISSNTWGAVQMLMFHEERGVLSLYIGPWVEANVVVSGEPDDREHRIRFLLSDTCTCVLDHLRAAVDHATGPVDDRVLNLFNHPHFQKKEG